MFSEQDQEDEDERLPEEISNNLKQEANFEIPNPEEDSNSMTSQEIVIGEPYHCQFFPLHPQVEEDDRFVIETETDHENFDNNEVTPSLASQQDEGVLTDQFVTVYPDEGVFQESEEPEPGSHHPSSEYVSRCLICNIITHKCGQSNSNVEFESSDHANVNNGINFVSDEYTTESTVNSKELFKILCLYMNLSSSVELMGNFNFPFCDSCQSSLKDLWDYHRSIERLILLTKKITSTLTAKIVQSYEQTKDRSYDEETTEGNGDGEFISAMNVKLVRQDVYKQYNVKVKLNDMSKESESVDGSGDIFENDCASNVSDISALIPVVQMDSLSPPPSPIQLNSNSSASTRRTAHSIDFKNIFLNMNKITLPRTRSSATSSRLLGSSQIRDTDCLPDSKQVLVQQRTSPRRRRERQNKTDRRNNKMVEISPNKFLYADTYYINKQKDSKYKCCLCGKKREGKYKLLQHIRVDHIRNNKTIKPKGRPRKVASTVADENGASTRVDPIADVVEVGESVDRSRSSLVDTIENDSNSEEILSELETATKRSSRRIKSLISGYRKVEPPDSEEAEDAIEYAEADDSDSDSQTNNVTKWVEVEPNKFLYANQYAYERMDDEQFTCETCGQIYPNQQKMNHHIKKSHVAPRKTTRVNNKFVEVGPDKYLYAQKFYVEKIEGRFKCCTCEYTTKGKYKMFEHLRTKHISQSENCVCDTCGKLFLRMDSLRAHKKYACKMAPSLEEGTSHICHQCGKSFKNIDYLKSHERIHGGDATKNFVCELCGKRFRNSSRLKDHMSTHHTGEKLFQCQFCEKRFTTYNNMHYHRIREHGKVSELLPGPTPGSSSASYQIGSFNLI